MVNSQKCISRFHYLTHDLEGISHEDLAEIACFNGIRWLQLRIKNRPEDEILKIAKEVKNICDRYDATLIINDHVSIAKLIGVQGVHLGKTDMPVSEARKLLGEEVIIGGTANTLEDVLQLQKEGVDYIGLGPFRFTSTKENLAPVLGIEGYSSILQYSNSTIPVIAIGGITAQDVPALLQSGVHGVAVSSAINLAEDPVAAIRKLLSLV